MSLSSDYFNSGVLVLTPSEKEFQRMLQLVPILRSYDNGDQGFLNEFYKGAWHPLPYAYNAQQPDFISNPLQWNLGKCLIALSSKGS
jgi:lipopolysaccharide biosynthesis glycosyltransferase